jgi:ribosomal protein S15P/S13E
MPKTKKLDKKPIWLKYTEQEVKDIILNLIKKDPNLTSEKIGLILRDSYGIPKTNIYDFKISHILKQAKLYKNPDLKNLTIKTEKLSKHLEKNKQDKRTARSLIITKAKLKKTKEYLERKKT